MEEGDCIEVFTEQLGGTKHKETSAKTTRTFINRTVCDVEICNEVTPSDPINPIDEGICFLSHNDPRTGSFISKGMKILPCDKA